MIDIFFHIGLHKTATTWFQRQLFPSLDGVQVVRTKYIDKIAAHLSTIDTSVNGSPTVIVSHEALGGSIAHRRSPGFATDRLESNLELIASLAPQRSIIVGFREHGSWLQSAYSQRATKNFGIDQDGYVKGFSLSDLSWRRKLETIGASCEAVFPFLYEELLRDPKLLVTDLCRFIGKPPPPNLDELLRIRENATPRSALGQFVSRSMLKLSRSSNRRHWKHHAFRVGAWCDNIYPKRRSLPLDPELAGALREDWNELLDLVGKRRGHDFSAYRKP